MRLFIALSFVLLAALYWAVSGGSGFKPEAWPRQTASAGSEDVPASASDVAATRAEPPSSDLVAPPPEPGALTLEPSLEAGAAVAPAAEPAAITGAAAAPAPSEPPSEPAAGPEGLPPTPIAPDEALAALAPDLAAPPAAGPSASPAAPAALVEAAAPASPSAGAGTRREVAGDRVNLRDGPGTSFAVVGRLARGEAAEVVESRDGRAPVRVGANEGWVSERFLAP